MALISPQAQAVTGTSPVFTAPTASDTFRPMERGALLIRTTGTATTATFVVPGNDTFGQAKPDVAVAASATDVKVVPTVAYVGAADTATGLVTVTFSGALTGVTVAYVLV